MLTVEASEPLSREARRSLEAHARRLQETITALERGVPAGERTPRAMGEAVAGFRGELRAVRRLLKTP